MLYVANIIVKSINNACFKKFSSYDSQGPSGALNFSIIRRFYESERTLKAICKLIDITFVLVEVNRPYLDPQNCYLP